MRAVARPPSSTTGSPRRGAGRGRGTPDSGSVSRQARASWGSCVEGARRADASLRRCRPGSRGREARARRQRGERSRRRPLGLHGTIGRSPAGPGVL
jgi:hypothetical protein